MIASVIAGVVVAVVLSPFGGKAHQHTEKGNRAYEQAEYEEALRAYTEAQVALPEAPELYYLNSRTSGKGRSWYRAHIRSA